MQLTVIPLLCEIETNTVKWPSLEAKVLYLIKFENSLPDGSFIFYTTWPSRIFRKQLSRTKMQRPIPIHIFMQPAIFNVNFPYKTAIYTVLSIWMGFRIVVRAAKEDFDGRFLWFVAEVNVRFYSIELNNKTGKTTSTEINLTYKMGR